MEQKGEEGGAAEQEEKVKHARQRAFCHLHPPSRSPFFFRKTTRTRTTPEQRWGCFLKMGNVYSIVFFLTHQSHLCHHRKQRICSPPWLASLTRKTCSCSPSPSALRTPPSQTTSTRILYDTCVRCTSNSLYFPTGIRWRWRRDLRRKEKVNVAVTLTSGQLLKRFYSCSVFPAARVAVFSFMKAKDTTARERDLYRSVKVENPSTLWLNLPCWSS